MLSITDQLTGIYNRRFLIEAIERERENCENGNDPYYTLMIDIDHFKTINDTYGHLYGDEILKCIAQTIQSCIRGHDVLARYGGEEFVVVMKSDKNHIIEVAERIRKNVEQQDYRKMKDFTISIGIAICDKNVSINDTFKDADKNLYMAKENGRNCTYMNMKPVVK